MAFAPKPQPEISMEILEKLAKEVDDLKKTFEKYFMGIERHAPEKERVRIQGALMKLKNVYTNNTAVKFKRDSIVAKFQLYGRYWDRTLTEIEEGRYKRDRFKANLRVGTLDDVTHHTTVADKAKDAADAKRDKAAAAGSPLNQDIEKLYKEYMMARIECSQPIEGLTKEKMVGSVAKSIPALKEKYKGKDIQFRVVIEDGKAKLKAIPK